MHIAIVGANGQIGKILVRKLAAQEHSVRAMIRNPEQQDTVAKLGGEPVIGDLEAEFADVLTGCDAVVFTAGSGGQTGGDKTLLIDLWGAVRSYKACTNAGIRRFLMVSALRSDDPGAGPERIRHYLVAKRIADEYLQRSGLDYTIARPGGLTNDAGTGRIDTSARRDNGLASISREDVAATLIACLDQNNTIGKTFDLVNGEMAIAEAVAAL